MGALKSQCATVLCNLAEASHATTHKVLGYKWLQQQGHEGCGFAFGADEAALRREEAGGHRLRQWQDMARWISR
jgi:hypothetical protein